MENITFEVKVIPNSSKNELIKIENGYKVRIKGAPVDGQANKMLIKFLSKEFKISQKSIEIIRGKTSKNKIISITKDNIKT
ncbi:MAG: DUF167 domain-containing protein [Clostridia bacterium]|jgi:hypothetical protein|nr:DUF167 domain-containing protein [Clostridia bacterium]